jgi:uncharacterized RDD family membrane protein YckC
MLRPRPTTLSVVTDRDDYWPGKIFGLPEQGPRSVPSLGRRILALCIDWALCVGVSVAFFDFNGFATGIVFVVMHMLFGVVIGGSPGHLLTKMRIATIRGGRLGIVAPLVRPLLIILVIPPLIMDRDQRGVHDRVVGTIMVSR